MTHGHTGIDRLLEDPAYARAASETLQALGTFRNNGVWNRVDI